MIHRTTKRIMELTLYSFVYEIQVCVSFVVFSQEDFLLWKRKKNREKEISCFPVNGMLAWLGLGVISFMTYTFSRCLSMLTDKPTGWENWSCLLSETYLGKFTIYVHNVYTANRNFTEFTVSNAEFKSIYC